MGRPIPDARLPRNVTQRVVSPTVARGNHQWKHIYAKFHIAAMDYDTVAFLDADVLLLRPLTELVELALAVPGTVVAPRAYWIGQPFAMTGTLVASADRRAGRARRRPATAVSKLDAVLGGSERGVGDSEMDWFNQRPANDISWVSGFYSGLRS